MAGIVSIKVPKWGLAMEEGTIVEWWKQEGDILQEGEDLVDIETTKMTNVYEAPVSGLLRRIVAKPGDVMPVGALIAVVADETVTDAQIDAFIEDFNVSFVPDAVGEGEDVQAIRTLTILGRDLRVGEAGLEKEGIPVVLVHGFGGDLNNWVLTIDALAEHRPVYALELPGHGESSKDVGDGGLQGLVQSLVEELTVLGVSKAHLVGHSLGGALVLAAATARPDLAASVSLLCPVGLPGGIMNQDYLDGFIAARRARDLKPVVELLFADKSLATRSLLEDLIRFKRLDGVSDALTRIAARLREEGSAYGRVADGLAGLTVPVLIIASRNDLIVGAPDAAALPANVRLEWLDDAGHMPHLEMAQKVNDLLIGQLSA